MKNVLEQIIANKRKEVDLLKSARPVNEFERSTYFQRECFSLKESIQNTSVAIISEIKRASPSAGNINAADNLEEIVLSYVNAGAAGLSILTDQKYFKGSTKDIRSIRDLHYKPILRKDFIIDEYQVLEAKSIGADCILLIAAALPPSELKLLARVAKSLGLEVLMEVKERNEIEPYLSDDIDLVGVNNRDLRNFEIDIQSSIDLFEAIPDSYCKISESGIDSPEKIKRLTEAGYEGFLIGSYFMEHGDPGMALNNLISLSKNMM